MREKTFNQILKLVRLYCKNGVPWHHHFLTLKCVFNKSGKYQIILENEKTRESFVSYFTSRPMKKLELLENLFFGRKK